MALTCTNTQSTGWTWGTIPDGPFIDQENSKHVPFQVTLRALTSFLQMAIFSLVITLSFDFLMEFAELYVNLWIPCLLVLNFTVAFDMSSGGTPNIVKHAVVFSLRY